MKRIFMILFLFVLITNINSQPVVNSTETLTGARIVIDPGHGGHDAANDRYIAATGFWESDGNWAKANFLKPMLEALGASVKLTRTGNTDADDLDLSVRSQIANDYNADYFHSIHSNGYLGQSDYTLILFRGYDDAPVYAGAKTMGAYLMDNINAGNRTTAKYNRGDWSFYPDWGTQGLGVLRGLNMPGTLSEGSFHDYIPESWRLMNDSYRKHEAISITRSFIQYFNDFPSSSGCIAGIVRDPAVTVSYYYISSLGDAKKPINNIKITVQPGNIVYNGDDKNNGYFLIEDLAPGQYKVIYEAENYKKDSSTVTVIANKTIFADKNLTMEANPNAPQIVSTTPANLAQGIMLKAPIVFNFDIKMNTASTQSALVIEPTIAGTYTWANDDKQMTFTPSTYYPIGSEIKVTLKNTAKTIFNVFLAQNYVFTFNTRSKLNLISAYPKNNDEKISTTVNVRAIFDAPIKQSTLPGNMSFTKSDGSSVPIYVDLAGYANGKITFDPQTALTPNESYKLVIKAGVGDTEGLFLGQDYEINFTVDPEVYQSGTVIDQFEAIGGWWDPNNSGSTVGTNPDATTFTIVTDKKVNGSKSGKISYTFTDVNGVCRTHNSTKPNIGSAASKFGMWIYGDLSYNTLEYWFYYNSSTNVMVKVDTLNWTGWKLKYINVSDITGTGDKLFHSVVIKQTTNGSLTGAIYLDDMQNSIVTDVNEIDELQGMPNTYALDQNFPNPFNPSTQIRFNLPEAAVVTLAVYDVLGQKVTTLVSNQSFNSGSFNVTWNGKNEFGNIVPSGVYFYRIETPNFVETKKMMMLK